MNQVVIETGRHSPTRDRTFIFTFKEDSALTYFKKRSITSYDFPKYIEGEIDAVSNGAGNVFTFDDIDRFEDYGFFKELQARKIFSIKINGEDINEPVRVLAAKHNATIKAPLIYHLQFIFNDNEEYIFNWFPTTGALTRQRNKSKTYQVKRLKECQTAEEALTECKKSI